MLFEKFKDRISSNKRPWCVLKFEIVRYGDYYRAALIKGRRLFPSLGNEQHEVSKSCHFFFQNKNET